MIKSLARKKGSQSRQRLQRLFRLDDVVSIICCQGKKEELWKEAKKAGDSAEKMSEEEFVTVEQQTDTAGGQR
jgi:hypothetical protein